MNGLYFDSFTGRHPLKRHEADLKDFRYQASGYEKLDGSGYILFWVINANWNFVEDITLDQLLRLKEIGYIFVAGTEKNPVNLEADSFFMQSMVLVQTETIVSSLDTDDVEFVPEHLLISETMAADVWCALVKLPCV